MEKVLLSIIERQPIEDKNLKQQLGFLEESISQLDLSLEGRLFPEIARFRKAFIGFRFKSPLNFIMLGNDFHEFFQMFYHAKLLTQYVTNFLTDTFFSLHQLHARSPLAQEEI